MIIHQNQNSPRPLSVRKAAELLEASRSGYYRWLQRPVFSGNDPDVDVREEIQKIAVEFPGYGYRRVTVELAKRGYPENHKRVLRLMRNDNLLCVRKKFKPKTTDSNHEHRIYPNLIKDLEINRLNQVWASDITYIQLAGEFVYLAVILDLYSRRCIGYAIGRNIDTQLTLDALEMALKDRWTPDLEGLIHHSDQGVQYASNLYTDKLKEYGIQISMSRKGNPYDNAFVESFIKTLKVEEVYLNEYRDMPEAIENIVPFIEEVYNRKRLHSSLGYRSPIEFEEEVSLNTNA
jgi:transposase InsO family protein